MTEVEKVSQFRGKLFRWLIPLLISGVAFWLVLQNVDLSQVWHSLRQVSFRTFLLASGAYFTSYMLRAFCWYIILRRKVPYKDVFFTMGAGYLLNNIFPFRLGEIGRAMLLDDPQGPSALEVLSSVVVERVFDVLLAAVFVLAVIPRILGGGFDQTLVIIAFVITLAGVAVLYLSARFRTKILSWLERWGEKADFIKNWVYPKAAQALEGLSVLLNPGAFLLAFGNLVISWLVAFGENYFVFQNLQPGAPFWWMIFVLSAAAFGAALPSVPAGLGVFEGVMVAAFSILGVAPEVAFTHAIIIHALAFVYANIFGLIGLRMRGEAVVGLYQHVIRRSKDVKSVG